eukprot:7818724-Pyramimonas_sp.AAC.1
MVLVPDVLGGLNNQLIALRRGDFGWHGVGIQLRTRWGVLLVASLCALDACAVALGSTQFNRQRDDDHQRRALLGLQAFNPSFPDIFSSKTSTSTSGTKRGTKPAGAVLSHSFRKEPSPLSKAELVRTWGLVGCIASRL